MFEVRALNGTEDKLSIRSLANPPSFDDTVGRVFFQDLQGNPVSDPSTCVKAPPLPTGQGNCTTHVEAFFSDANATLKTATMQSCGIMSWIPTTGASGHLYGQWVHADHPTPAPPGAMCDWQPGFNLYREVGDGTGQAEYFTLENVRQGDATNQTTVKIHSVNGTFPDAVARVEEVGAGTPGKIAFSVEKLFGGEPYRGIMRTNSAGGPACCQIETSPEGLPVLKRCPVLSWWSRESGSTSCWEPVGSSTPSEPIGACGE
jgi:hypothetical protein